MARHENPEHWEDGAQVCLWSPGFDSTTEATVVNGALVDLTALLRAKVANTSQLPEVAAALKAVEQILAAPERVIDFDPKVMAAIEAAMSVEVPEETITELSPKRADVLVHCKIDEAERLVNICAGRGGPFVAGC